MGTPATLYLLCGKMAAGKSTHAKKLAAELQVVVLSEDRFLAALYPGEITDVPSYVKYSGRLKLALEGMIVDMLSRHTSLILDFPANTVSQRAWLLGLATKAKAQHELQFIDLPDSTCKSQLEKRAAEQPERAATDTAAMFDAITRYFEPPAEGEGLNIVQVSRAG